ncbi:fibronectin type III domain-containing protein 7 [Xenopus laevis]|uniref:Fibronectin type III domain-containing protein 7 n=2 Tax=Xenopus laevis TaxID=8355 RepID=A0A1L8GNC7_XENLA|nr:fibronectin type III domain-containing protein 7 [Xenopus laevis]OCT85306.1 hypothetical protein XELAEV_18023471mg [Xenopus laevis]
MGAEPPNRSIILLFLLSSLLPMASCSDFSISIFEVTSRSFYVQWSKVPGAMSYKISASPDILTGEPAFSVFDATTIIGSVNTLLPNTNYQVTVEAMNEYGAVLAQAQTSHFTAPEVPSIDQTYSKLSGSITVEWTDVPGATSYQVTAQDGESFFQTIVSSSPGTVTGLQGATTYTIRVRSINSAGKSQPSLPKMAKTVLGSVSVTVDSPASDAIIVSWQPVSAAVLYSVSLMRSDGLGNRWNENTTSTSINFTSLDPGTVYTIKLNAWDDQGIPGDDITFIHLTRPAAPSDVQMTFSNGGSDAIFSVIGADATTNYTVHLFTGNTSMNCSTVSASCTVYSLECGLEYAVYVEAINEAGSSLSSKSWNLKSVPCAPSAITVAIEEAGNLSVSWTTENLSEYYVVFVKSDDGLEVHCNTSQTHCYFPADCGFIYSMSVFAYNKAGQSPPGEVFTYTTAPCCPSDFSAEYKSSDTLEIVWSPVRGAELYETKADDGNNVILCNDTATLCTLSGLQCNTLFNVTVYSLSEYRGSNTSCASKYMKTAPCSPEITNITNINETTFTVYWNANNNDALYTVTAKGEDGFWDCTSANTYCSLGDLPCGSLYMVSVVAESIEGTSLPSYSMPLETAPCCPANLSVLQVTQSVTNISWSLSKGAKTYNSVLVSPKGEAKCHTLQNHCLLGCITCGTSYSVSIEAISETGLTSVCNYHGYSSSECCPFGVKLLYSSSNNGIRVSWRASSGPGNYSASLHGSKGNFTCTPSSNLSYCDVTEIPCGDVYTVVVSPITAGESQTLFCPKKMYSVACSGNSLGTVIYRGKRSIS